MDEDDPGKEHQREEGCGEARTDVRGDGEACGDQGAAGEPGEEEVEGNPVRDERGDPVGCLEMQGAEDDEGNAEEPAGERGEAWGGYPLVCFGLWWAGRRRPRVRMSDRFRNLLGANRRSWSSSSAGLIAGL